MLDIIKTSISEVVVLKPKKFEDDRGFFAETYNKGRMLEVAGFSGDFVQDNVSLSKNKGTIRGIHFQTPPFAQNKLVRVIKGSIIDVAVDIRKGSPTYGEYVSVELSSDSFEQLLVPKGFAHAFCTLEDNTEVVYKVTDFYAPQSDSGIIWNDPDINIKWPFPDSEIVLSDKDTKLSKLKDLVDVFIYELPK